MITRFAPSPTGHLHLGHAYAAKVAHDLAAEHNRDRELAGQASFLLRFEDIDHTRTRPEYYQSCEDDLHWLGFSNYEKPPLRQSDRLPAYAQALEQLKSLGVLYPCTCTRKEIAAESSQGKHLSAELSHLTNAPHGPEGPHYPGTCKKHPPTELPPPNQISWRLDTQKASQLTGPLTFNSIDDCLQSQQLEDEHHQRNTPVNPHLLGDLILARKDIGTSYHLAVTIDDAHQHITHVTRGHDLLPATHIHRTLQALLNLPEPTYLHHPLVLDENGNRLAKRNDPLTLKTLREQGHHPSELLQNLNLTPS